MKINCLNPNHKDSIPSLHVYEDGCFCFSCGFTCKIEDVLNAEEIKEFKKIPKEKENIKEAIKYIETLPVYKIRGLPLSLDFSGYYIVWPDKSYYKKRLTETKSRYVGPRGHRPPLFWCRQRSTKSKTLVIVEGEINALSLDLAVGDHPGISVVSPGSASNLQSFLDEYLWFDDIYIIVDKDPAGFANGWGLKNTLRSKNKNVRLITVSPDFNETLQSGGVEAVKQQLFGEL